jgi:hypothetical protein
VGGGFTSISPAAHFSHARIGWVSLRPRGTHAPGWMDGRDAVASARARRRLQWARNRGRPNRWSTAPSRGSRLTHTPPGAGSERERRAPARDGRGRAPLRTGCADVQARGVPQRCQLEPRVLQPRRAVRPHAPNPWASAWLGRAAPATHPPAAVRGSCARWRAVGYVVASLVSLRIAPKTARSGQLRRRGDTTIKPRGIRLKFRYVVSGSDSGLVYIWNTDTGKSLAPLEGHKCAAARQPVASPLGRRRAEAAALRWERWEAYWSAVGDHRQCWRRPCDRG